MNWLIHLIDEGVAAAARLVMLLQHQDTFTRLNKTNHLRTHWRQRQAEVYILENSPSRGLCGVGMEVLTVKLWKGRRKHRGKCERKRKIKGKNKDTKAALTNKKRHVERGGNIMGWGWAGTSVSDQQKKYINPWQWQQVSIFWSETHSLRNTDN